MVVRRPSEEVAIDETVPLVPNRTPFRELAKLVTPLILSEPRLATLAKRLVEVVVASVVVPVTPKFPPIVCPPETSDPTVRAPPIFAFPETFKLASVVLPATNDPPIAVLPPIVVLLEIVREFPLKLEVPPVMAEPIAEV